MIHDEYNEYNPSLDTLNGPSYDEDDDDADVDSSDLSYWNTLYRYQVDYIKSRLMSRLSSHYPALLQQHDDADLRNILFLKFLINEQTIISLILSSFL